MAKFFQTKRAKKRTITVLAVTLATTLSLGALAACTTTDPEEPDTEEETVARVDEQLLKNGNFEFYSDNNKTEQKKKLQLIGTPDNWTHSLSTTGSYSAPSSESKSGIVNTGEWSYFTTPGRPFTSKDDALANWEAEGVTAYDRIKFYEDNDIDSKDDFEYYTDYKYTVDYDDVKPFYDEESKTALVANPGTYSADMTEKSVLMIQNNATLNSKQVYGSGQYYTSSTNITIAAGTAVELNFWVKTSNLVHRENKKVEKDAGAYIAVTNTVGGTTLDQFKIYNINTEKQNPAGANNGWMNYKVYARASTFATSTVKVVLGLGSGSSADTQGLVNGYAFFDDITCTKISNAEYETATASVNMTCGAKSTASEKQFNADVFTADSAITDKTNFALDLLDGKTFDSVALNDVTIDGTKETANGKTYSPEDYGIDFGDKAEDVTTVASVATLKTTQNATLKKILDKDFEKFPFDQNTSTIMLFSKTGAPYTAKMNSDSFTLAPEKSMLVSFFTKTSKMQTFTGAGITLIDNATQAETEITPFDSTAASTVNIDDERKDIYDGWVQCFFFVTNNSKVEKSFSLHFTYGPTDIVNSTADSYADGYAAFTNFKTHPITAYEASYVTTGSYAVKAALTTASQDKGSKFDDVANNNSDSIENGLAIPANYWGVKGNDPRVGGNGTVSKPDVTPEGVQAGLLNKNNLGAYTSLSSFGSLSDILGTATQPVGIFNSQKAATSYGFIACTTTLFSGNTTKRISVRVKVSAGAKAYVYLVDKDLVGNIAPDLPGVTYWYDDDGNITTKDPSDESYSKKTDIAYKLGADGLYTNAQNTADTAKYANLANYAKDDDKNLVVEDDTIAYYYNATDSKYYAYYDEDTKVYSTPVVDFPDSFKTAYARYNYVGAEYDSMIVVDGTKDGVADKWITVNFYVKSGDQTRDYRLEVWSGARDNSFINEANSYVLFDGPTDADYSDYDKILASAVSLKKEELGIHDEHENLPKDVASYYTYTFYDDVNYLRYDETQDEEKAGNPYGSYVQSEKTEGIAYFYYEDTTTLPQEPNYRMFINHSLDEVTVSKDTLDTDDSTTDEEETTDGELDWANLLILGSSIALVAALALVIVSILVRKLVKKYGRKDKKIKVKGKKKATTETPAPVEQPVEAPTEKLDENDPYNE